MKPERIQSIEPTEDEPRQSVLVRALRAVAKAIEAVADLFAA